MNPGTLNRARMLEHRVQHLAEMPNYMLEHWFQQHIQGYLFNNNAANTNTQQYIFSFFKKIYQI